LLLLPLPLFTIFLIPISILQDLKAAEPRFELPGFAK
jgi:hypothetical protein